MYKGTLVISKILKVLGIIAASLAIIYIPLGIMSEISSANSLNEYYGSSHYEPNIGSVFILSLVMGLFALMVYGIGELFAIMRDMALSLKVIALEYIPKKRTEKRIKPIKKRIG